MSTFLDNEKPFLLTLPLNEVGVASSRGVFY